MGRIWWRRGGIQTGSDPAARTSWPGRRDKGTLEQGQRPPSGVMEIRPGARMTQGPVSQTSSLVLDHRRQTQRQGLAGLAGWQKVGRNAGKQAPFVAAALAFDAGRGILPNHGGQGQGRAIIGKGIDRPFTRGREVELTVPRLARYADEGLAAAMPPEPILARWDRRGRNGQGPARCPQAVIQLESAILGPGESRPQAPAIRHRRGGVTDQCLPKP